LSENTLGTKRFSFQNVLDAILNQKEIKIMDIIIEDGKEKRVLNKKETMIAREKKELVLTKFDDWVHKDNERSNRLTNLYNEIFNSNVERKFNGDYLSFKGINLNIVLREIQINAIARIIESKNTLIGHLVGAGKTFTLIAAGMKLREIGLAKKPMYVVPNHLIREWAQKFIELFPNAKVLATEESDFIPKNRNKFLARIATGDWDAVIIPHSSFKKIRMSESYSREFISQEIRAVENAILEYENSNSSGTRVIKALERTKKTLSVKLERLEKVEDKDNLLTFEEIGCDLLLVDECQSFKNLAFHTRMSRISGVNNTNSQKAYDMYMKTQYISKHKRGVVFATATPISNSMSEMFTMKRYLQSDYLKKMGLFHFDAWASVFGETVNKLEFSPDGSTYRFKTRFCRFNNIPELMSMFKIFTDIVTDQDVNLPKPKLKGGKATVVLCEPTKELKEYISTLVERAERIHSGSVSKEVDNMLVIVSDGRKAALSEKLFNPFAITGKESKVYKATQNIYQIYKKYDIHKSTQLVFCDLSTPSDKYNVYDELKEMLIDVGIPAEEIAFIHDYKSFSNREELFVKVRKGKIRVLLGSTQKMGTGMNVQKKLFAIHHLDPPWRPSDIAQRDGRILRQGNENFELGNEVMIFRYVTKESFDAYSWQILENKASFIQQIVNGNSDVRHMSDIEDASLSYAEIKALASGNPLILKKFEVESKIREYELLRKQYIINISSIKIRIYSALSKKTEIGERITKIKEFISIRNSNSNEIMGLTIKNHVFKDIKDAAAFIIDYSTIIKVHHTEELLKYKGFKVFIKSSIEYDIIVKSIYISTDNDVKVTKFDIPKVPGFLFKKVDEYINGFEEKIKDLEQRIIDVDKIVEVGEREKGKEFKYENSLKTLRNEINTINHNLGIDKDDAISNEEEVV
jgi:hypothetical protein